MRSGIANIFILVLLTVAAVSQAGNPGRSILVIGDSLSAGYGIAQRDSWVSLLSDRLQAEGYGYAVVNASITGDTTTGGLTRLKRALPEHRPAVVIIELGGNDGLRGTPINVIRRNLGQMIELARDAGARVILAGMQIPPNYGSRYTSAFRDLYFELADEYGVALIKFFLAGVALDDSLFQEDGIHPRAEAQPLLLDNVWQVLQGELDQVAEAAHASPEMQPVARTAPAPVSSPR